jgi:hypothetical protein
VTNRGRPNRLAAVAAITTAIIVAGIGWYIRPSGHLEPGDCYSESAADQRVQVSCDRPHDGEIFLMLDHPADQGARMPNSYSLTAWAEVQCGPAFRSYTGKSRPSDDGLSVVVWLPTPTSWTEGAREIECAVVNGSGAQLTDRIGAS